MRDIGLQRLGHRLCILPAFGRQQLDALGQQDRRLALDHGLILQVLHHFYPFGQRRLQRGQRLARQRCAGLGRIALPGHGIGNVEAGGIEQNLSPSGPVGGQRILGLGAAQFVELLAQWSGSALVFDAELLEHFLHQLLGWRTRQPLAHARSPVPGGGRGEGTAGKGVELLKIMGFRIGVGHKGTRLGLRRILKSEGPVHRLATG